MLLFSVHFPGTSILIRLSRSLSCSEQCYVRSPDQTSTLRNRDLVSSRRTSLVCGSRLSPRSTSAGEFVGYAPWSQVHVSAGGRFFHVLPAVWEASLFLYCGSSPRGCVIPMLPHPPSPPCYLRGRTRLNISPFASLVVGLFETAIHGLTSLAETAYARTNVPPGPRNLRRQFGLAFNRIFATYSR